MGYTFALVAVGVVGVKGPNAFQHRVDAPANLDPFRLEPALQIVVVGGADPERQVGR